MGPANFQNACGDFPNVPVKCSQELFSFIACHLRHMMFWWSKKTQKMARKSLFLFEKNLIKAVLKTQHLLRKTIIRFNYAEFLPSEYKSSDSCKCVSVLCVSHHHKTNILLHRACCQRTTSIQLSNLNNESSKISVVITESNTTSKSILIFCWYPNCKGYSSFIFNEIGTEQRIWETYALL